MPQLRVLRVLLPMIRIWRSYFRSWREAASALGTSLPGPAFATAAQPRVTRANNSSSTVCREQPGALRSFWRSRGNSTRSRSDTVAKVRGSPQASQRTSSNKASKYFYKAPSVAFEGSGSPQAAAAWTCKHPSAMRASSRMDIKMTRRASVCASSS